MATLNLAARVPPMFTGENYTVWAIKMQTFLKGQNLWEVVEGGGQNVPPLMRNPTLNEIKKYEELVSKDPKALSCIQSAVSEGIFTRIMACKSAKEAWDRLKEEFEGSTKVKRFKLLTLKREFELLRMTERESVKEFSARLMEIVNRIRLHGDEFPEERIVEKILVSLPEKFESKISAIEESCDLSTLSVAELISKLHATEQRSSVRQMQVTEEAFQVKQIGNYRKDGKKQQGKGKQPNFSRKIKFPPCSTCGKTNHLEKDCWQKHGKPQIQCNYCKKFGHVEKYCKAKQNQNDQQVSSQSKNQQAHFTEDQIEAETEAKLFIASQNSVTNNNNVWYIDSGCTRHMVKEESLFSHLDKRNKIKVRLGNGGIIQAQGRGTVKIKTSTELISFAALSYKGMEEIVYGESEAEDNETQVAKFPQLRFLTLRDLPMLQGFCSKVKQLPPSQKRQKRLKSYPGIEGLFPEDELDVGLPFFDRRAFFPNLEFLSMSSIACQETQYDEPSFNLSDLTSSSESGCHDVKYLFGCSFASNLSKLKQLEVSCCEFLEGVVQSDEFGAEMIMQNIIPNLHVLGLADLPNLTRFCDGFVVEFRFLIKLSIRKCPALKTFIGLGFNLGKTQRNPPLFDRKVEFPSLKHMDIHFMSNLKRAWGNELSAASFRKLESMSFRHCENLQTVFPSNDLTRFRALEKLELDHCGLLQEIYQLSGFSDEGRSSVMAFELRYLSINSLHGLKHIWSKDPQGIFTFKNLQFVYVDSCMSLNSIFPTSIAKDLAELEIVEIRNALGT